MNDEFTFSERVRLSNIQLILDICKEVDDKVDFLKVARARLDNLISELEASSNSVYQSNTQETSTSQETST